MPMTENIVHKKYRILVDSINDIYDRISMWKKSEDIELTDGSDLDTKLSNMNTVISANLSNLATVEPSTTASQAYAKGNLLVLNNQLYKVIATIQSGGTIVTSGSAANVQAITIGTFSNMLTASNGSYFYFDHVNGHYGFYTDSAKTNFVQIT